MAKYTIEVTVTREIGTARPETHISWNAQRIDPPWKAVGAGVVDWPGGTEDDAVLGGVYESIKDAEASGETLALDDISAEVVRVTAQVRRGVTAGAQRPPPTPISCRAAYANVMARSRPL